MPQDPRDFELAHKNSCRIAGLALVLLRNGLATEGQIKQAIAECSKNVDSVAQTNPIIDPTDKGGDFKIQG